MRNDSFPIWWRELSTHFRKDGKQKKEKYHPFLKIALFSNFNLSSLETLFRI